VFHKGAYRKLQPKNRSQIRAFAIERLASLVGAICSWYPRGMALAEGNPFAS
jgi:hypothetical protein